MQRGAKNRSVGNKRETVHSGRIEVRHEDNGVIGRSVSPKVLEEGWRIWALCFHPGATEPEVLRRCVGSGTRLGEGGFVPWNGYFSEGRAPLTSVAPAG